ncbi:MAG: ThiF family adenylyltransferase [Candidatus Contendobacter sp.]|nr:ThiF family adenylyltransferase [Candidatus Contendobacter sp.]
MTLVDLTIQERHLDSLRELVLRNDGIEAAAYVLCGENRVACDPWERRARRRLTSYEVLPIPAEDRVSASARHVTWSTASFVRLLKRAKEENLVASIAHAHPGGPARFSDQDDRNERELARLAQNRNGQNAAMLSVLLTGAGDIRARLWPDTHAPIDTETVRVVGQRLSFHGMSEVTHGLDAFARQALAFGPAVNSRLRALRVGIVGCGGTGSAAAMLLARLGIGQIVLFDDDIVEASNLNRLHGARRSDADAMRPKVDVVAREIAELGIGVRAVPLRGWINDPVVRDALKACDVIFGCTDDHDGRLLLNRVAYFYLIPVIDMGLAIDPAPDGNGLRDLSGRVTVLTPGAPCLLCRGIVDPVTARDEDLRRRQPEEYERRKREAYVRGGGNPAPAVVTFTTATACMAVDELLQALMGFRGPDGWAWQRTRRFDVMQDRRPGAVQNPSCPICVETGYWGRADIEPFLDRVG